MDTFGLKSQNIRKKNISIKDIVLSQDDEKLFNGEDYKRKLMPVKMSDGRICEALFYCHRIKKRGKRYVRGIVMTIATFPKAYSNSSLNSLRAS